MGAQSISFTFKGLNGTAWVEIAAPPNFGIDGNGVQLSTTTSAGVSLSGMTVSTRRVTVVSSAAIDNATVKVYLIGDPIPRYIGGPMSLPTGTTLSIQVDNGPTESVNPGAEWSVGTG